MTFLFAGIPVLGLLFFFTAGSRGVMGAIILGISAVSADLLWQWLRFILDQKLGPKFLLTLIFTGFIIRLACLIIFLKIAEASLTGTDFYLMASMLLLILLSQKLLAFIVSRREEKPHAS
jgi:hypothetical protein